MSTARATAQASAPRAGALPSALISQSQPAPATSTSSFDDGGGPAIDRPSGGGGEHAPVFQSHDQPGWQPTVVRLVDVLVDGLRVQAGAVAPRKSAAETTKGKRR